MHYIRAGISMDQMPLEAVMGETRVLFMDDEKVITAAALRPHDIQRGERILFKTRNSARCWNSDEFFDDFVYIAPDAAQLLAEVGAQRLAWITCPLAAFIVTALKRIRFCWVPAFG